MQINTGNNIQKLTKYSLSIIIVSLFALYPRIMLLGGNPVTDEGVYALYSQLYYYEFSAHIDLLKFAPLAFYSMLTSWVFMVDFNHFYGLRIIDAFCCLIVANLLLYITFKSSKNLFGSIIITSIFIFAMNQPVFIQYGYKNSYFVALIPLLVAYIVFDSKSCVAKWYLIGALLALSVLLRETFLCFSIVSWFTIWAFYGFKSILKLTISAVLTFCLMVFFILYSRNQINDGFNFLYGYKILSSFYASTSNLILKLFIENGMVFIKESSYTLEVFLLTLLFAAVSIVKNKLKLNYGRILFLIINLLAILLEPASKIGFPYHFSLISVVLCILSAVLIKNISDNGLKWFIMLSLIISICGVYPQARNLYQFYQGFGKHNILTTYKGYKDSTYINKDNYLMLANEINKYKHKGDTLAMSGFMSAIYPITDLLPTSYLLSNLNFTMAFTNYNLYELRKIILQQTPTFIFITNRDLPYVDILESVIKMCPEYKKIAYIPKNEKNQYGSFGGTLYMKR